ncbi:hypothetical protein GCM10022254_59870 [Actinomadura meridiana]|uniref:Uncharacterized protein n=1 Tax=Actinomadura meridiana TaxID=559626 RepID=A0ABP8CHU2_9ACTN
MNRSARRLLSVAVLAPTVTALAVATAPAYAEVGPSTALLYETAAAASPVTQAVPEPVVGGAGRTAELATTTADQVFLAAPSSSGLRSANERHCKLKPGKSVKQHTGVGLPDAALPSLGKGAPAKLPKGDCLAAQRRSRTDPLPAPAGAATKVPQTILKDVGKVSKTVRGSKLGALPGMRSAGPNARGATVPVSSPLPDVPSVLGNAAQNGQVGDVTSTLGGARTSGQSPNVGNVPSTLAGAKPAGVPVGQVLFPPAGRHAHPAPPNDVLGQTNDTVNQTGGGLDQVTSLAKVPGVG